MIVNSHKLKDIIEQLGVSQKSFADEVGLSQQRVSNLIKSPQSISKQTIYILQARFNVNPDWLLEGKGEMFLPAGNLIPEGQIRVPIVGTVAAGTPSEAIELTDEYFTFPKSLYAKEIDRIAIPIQNDSLADIHILTGDVIILQKPMNGSHINSGDHVMITFNGDPYYGKVMFRSKDIELKPENSQYPIKNFENDKFTMVGKIVGLFRNYY